ncbi:MAG: tyrosine-type recombinase/integrase, partial [Bacillota bacterium]|nr:tyrosine-type recombinase/integrase [Bacillota bacterium]
MYIKNHFKPYFNKMKVNQVTNMHIQEYISIKLKTLSSTTVRKHFFTLSKLFHDALRIKSPCIDIKAPKNEEFKPIIPTEKEFNTIYQTFKEISPEDEVIILLAGWCGLRRGEIFALEWNDIDEINGTIKIDQALALEEEGYNFELKDPKSHNGIRTIATPDHLIKLIMSLKNTTINLKRFKKNKTLKTDQKKNKSDLKHFIFQQDPHSFTKKYCRIIKGGNLPHIRFHDLRHYHASLLYKNEVPDQYAAERLGHDVWVLKKTYQHLGLEETKELDEKVKNMFK